MSKITVMPIHQPDEGSNPVNCSSCLCTQLICRCKYSQIFVQGFWYMLLSRQSYLFWCVLPFKNHSGPQRLALLASKLFAATTQSRWPAAALYCSAGPSSETWIWATSCRKTQSLISPDSALLCESFCEGKGGVKSLHCSCCASSWQFTLAFCCFLCSLGGASSHLVSNPAVSQVVVAMNPQFAKRKVLSVKTYMNQHKLIQKKSGKEQVLVLHTNFFFSFLFRETLYSRSSAVFDQ